MGGRSVVIVILVGVLTAAGGHAVDRDAYHTFAEVQDQLAAWAAEHPQLELETIGTSAGGRSLLLAQLAGAGAVAPDERPAVLVAANAAGFHNSGTEAALHLISRLLESKELLESRTFYVLPVLNPDAHDGMFATPVSRRAGNGQALDHDVDGLIGEDGPDDLDGNGVITALRIPDPEGRWQPHSDDPRVMVEADPLAERSGGWRLETEGMDDDHDGAFNEDPAEGVVVDNNFAHAFPFPQRSAGPWPSFAPESKSVMDFLLGHRNVALAVVYGPANNLLEAPRSTGGVGDLGKQKFKVPAFAAEMLGFEEDEEYTLDEVWEVAKELPFVVRNQVTKEQLAQFLGAGPATEMQEEDSELLSHLAKPYAERMKEAGLDTKRPVRQYARGGVTPWLYYQYGVLALELDVWGVPAAEKGDEGDDTMLTVDSLEEMSSEELLALGEERIAAFLEEVGAPPQFTAAMVIQRVESGQVTPQMMARMVRQMGGGGSSDAAGDDDPQVQRQREVLDWVAEHVPEALTPWTAVNLSDGTAAEVGGVDPFIEIAPPMSVLAPALEVHTDTVLDLAGQLARVEVVSLDAEPLGSGVYRVRAVAQNRGFLPTHTAMAVRARVRLPVRLRLVTSDGVELVTGTDTVTSERLEGSSGTVAGEWLVRAREGREITVEVLTDAAGSSGAKIVVGEGV